MSYSEYIASMGHPVVSIGHPIDLEAYLEEGKQVRKFGRNSETQLYRTYLIKVYKL